LDRLANNGSIVGASIVKPKATNMENVFVALACDLLAGLTSGTLEAQRAPRVAITRVAEEMPDYQAAQQARDGHASNLRMEIAKEYDQIKAMYNEDQAEQVLLPEDARKKKEEEIREREKQVRDLQRDKFGPEGALFRKRQDLVQPIQERVYGAITQYADDRGFDFIFDKGGTGGLIYSSAEFDKTDDIIRVLSK